MSRWTARCPQSAQPVNAGAPVPRRAPDLDYQRRYATQPGLAGATDMEAMRHHAIKGMREQPTAVSPVSRQLHDQHLDGTAVGRRALRSGAACLPRRSQSALHTVAASGIETNSPRSGRRSRAVPRDRRPETGVATKSVQQGFLHKKWEDRLKSSVAMVAIRLSKSSRGLVRSLSRAIRPCVREWPARFRLVGYQAC